MCKQTEQQLRSHEEEAEIVLQQWQESGQLPSPEVLARVITTRDQVMSQNIAEVFIKPVTIIDDIKVKLKLL